VLKVGKYGLPILGVGAFAYLFSKGDRWRAWAAVFMGVGMVFFGLEIMKDGCAIIKQDPDFEGWFQRFQADSYLGVLQCALAGCVLTMVLQSSSATLVITISLAFEGVISYQTAAALVLGENIGTTITAILASLGATTNARRAAYFHVIFNMIGVLWITFIFAWYIALVQRVVGLDVAASVIEDGKETFPNTTPAIAATHTIFNITNTIIFIPFMRIFVQLLERIVPNKEYKEKPRLTDLDIRMLETPPMAIEQSRREIEKMADSCTKMLDWLRQLMKQDEPDTTLGDRLRKREQVLDSMHDEVAEYVTHLLSGNVPHSVADEARLQLRMADEFESVSDYIVNMDNFDRKLRRDDHRFSVEQRDGFDQLNEHVAELLEEVNTALKLKNRNIVTEIEPMSKRIRNEIKQLRRKHLDDLSSSVIHPRVSVAYLATLNAYSRVRDHVYNIAESVSGEK